MIKEHFAEHVGKIQRHWDAELENNGFDGALVHSGTPLVSFLDDYEYAFRPNPLFLWWMPLVHHHDSVLLVRPDREPKLYFYQPDDYWYLPPSDPDPWWADHFDIEVCRNPMDWRSAVAQNDGHHWAAIGDSPALSEVFEPGQINPEALVTGLHIRRTRKTPYEIACMAEASRLAVKAHLAAEAAFRAGKSELRIHQAYLAACQQTDATLPYHNIVALNQHGSVLHYQGRDVQPPENVLSFLIDAGCTCHAYCSDITRTYSREDGLFNDMIGAMDRVQQDLAARVRSGLDYRELHLDAHRMIAGLLSEFGVISLDPDEAVDCGLSSVFYPHGLGHYIGLQTHDVAGLIDNEGKALERPEGHPFLRLTRVLEKDNVLTIEPGLYFIEPLLSKWKNEHRDGSINWSRVEELQAYGGIRIEDNVVVGDGESRNLTREAFAAAAR